MTTAYLKETLWLNSHPVVASPPPSDEALASVKVLRTVILKYVRNRVPALLHGRSNPTCLVFDEVVDPKPSLFLGEHEDESIFFFP